MEEPRKGASKNFAMTVNFDHRFSYKEWFDDDFSVFFERDKAVKYFVMTVERGEDTGNTHMQIYLETIKRVRFNQVLEWDTWKAEGILNPHIECRQGTRTQARHYCMMPCGDVSCKKCREYNAKDNYIDGPFELGTWSTEQGRRTDLDTFAQRVLDGERLTDIAKDMPGTTMRYQHLAIALLNRCKQLSFNTDRKVILAIGPAGCGKTRMARTLHPGVDGADFWESPIFSHQWFNDVTGAKQVLFDDFDGKLSAFPLRALLRLLDKYAIKVPSKGGFEFWDPLWVYLTTNFHPHNWYDWSERRTQRRALERRFDEVHWWDGAGILTVFSAQQPVVWRRFWDARPSVVEHGHVEGDGRDTLPNYMSTEEAELAYFNFF